MNERIRELVRESNLDMYGLGKERHRWEYTVEKFAELIVKECADKIVSKGTWVGLTRMDLIKCGVLPFGMSYELCQAIEAKLKQKNGYSEDKNTRGQE